MKRVLVTGAGGFIGHHCLRYLEAAGFEVHAVSRRPRSGQTAWHSADLLEPGSAARLIAHIRPTHLLNLAWCTEPGRYWTSLDNARWLATAVELQLAFAENGGVRAVHAGTCAEYDWSAGVCVEGTTPLAPRTFYGQCKRALLLVVREIAQQTKSSFAWGRLFFLYGPGERAERLVPQVIRGLAAGEEVPCTAGEQERDFLYVEDAAAAFAALLSSDVEGEINIASGQAIKVKEFVERIADRFQRRSLVRFGALPIAAEEPSVLAADVTRLREHVRFVPRFGLDEGLERSIRWWQR
jgi:nucleoside-diphosphate-sugar epimerase